MSARDLVIVGQAPSRTSDPSKPFSGRSGRRLLELAGLTYDELAERAKLVNLGDRYPGRSKSGKGDRFPGPPYAHVSEGMAPGARIILVGRETAVAFIGSVMRGVAYCRWTGGGVAVLPHPSGVNHWWNDPRNVRRARRFLRRALDSSGLASAGVTATERSSLNGREEANARGRSL